MLTIRSDSKYKKHISKQGVQENISMLGVSHPRRIGLLCAGMSKETGRDQESWGPLASFPQSPTVKIMALDHLSNVLGRERSQGIF